MSSFLPSSDRSRNSIATSSPPPPSLSSPSLLVLSSLLSPSQSNLSPSTSSPSAVVCGSASALLIPPYRVATTLPTDTNLAKVSASYHISLLSVSTPRHHPKSMLMLRSEIPLTTPQTESQIRGSLPSSASSSAGLISEIWFLLLSTSNNLTFVVGRVVSSNKPHLFISLNGRSAGSPKTEITNPSVVHPTIVPSTQAAEACASAASAHASSMSS